MSDTERVSTSNGGPELNPPAEPLITRKMERRGLVGNLLEEYASLAPEDAKGRERIRDIFDSLFDQAEQTDPDTGFYNKQGLAEELPRLMDWSTRTGRPLSILFLDGYRLKRVNEQINYDAGTQVILATAQAIKEATRKSDVQARINPDDFDEEDNLPGKHVATRPGGDEFVVILFGSNQFDAAEVAQRIQRKIAEIAPEKIPFYKSKFGEDYTVRAGLVQYNPDVDKNPVQLLRRADDALNIAKKESIPGMICVSNYNPQSGTNEITSLKGLQIQFPGLN